LLIKDAWHTHSLKDKFRIWFMPLGWRPADVVDQFPVYKIKDVFHFEKFDPDASSGLISFCWFQMVMVLVFVSYLFGNIALIGSPGMFYYGAFIYMMVYAYTELLDKSSSAWKWQLLTWAFGIFILWQQGDWFGASKLIPFINYLVASYLGLSAMASFWFCNSFNRPATS
jgi:hypothetical protein